MIKTKPKYLVGSLVLFFLVSKPIPSEAAQRIWDGGGGSNTSWHLAANWAFDVPPGANDDVIIPSGFDVVLDADASVQAIVVQGNSSLLIENDVVLSLDHGSLPFCINLSGSSSLENLGEIIVDDASTNGILVLGASTFDNEGTITLNDGDGTANDAGIVIEDGLFDNSGAVTGNGFSTLVSHTGTSGNFRNNSGGTLAGSGDVDADAFTGNGGVIFAGIPGAPGIMNFIGNANLSNTTIRLELSASGMAGTDFGQVTIAGDATLGGTTILEVEWTGTTDPVTGNTFILINPTGQIIGGLAMSSSLPDCCIWVINDNGGLGPISIVVDVFLPVELIGLRGEAGQTSVSLFWKTGSETMNLGWEVEHSIDGADWQPIGFVSGAGTTPLAQSYSYEHLQPVKSVNYYRLRQIDWDGNQEFSSIVSISMPESKREDLMAVYPNPAPSSGILTVKLPAANNADRILKVYYSDGRLIYRTAAIHDEIQIHSENWAEGVYFLALESEKDAQIFRLFVRGD